MHCYTISELIDIIKELEESYSDDWNDLVKMSVTEDIYYYRELLHKLYKGW